MSVIMNSINVLALFYVEKLPSKMAFVTGGIKITLITWITSENSELFSVDRFYVCERKNMSDDEEEVVLGYSMK